MKIVFIGKFRRIEDENVIAVALEKNGAIVIRMEEEDYKHVDFLEVIKRELPDYVLFTKLRTKENPLDLINEIKKLGIKTVSWTFDLLIGHPPRELLINTMDWLKADEVYLTDGGHTEEYKAKGIDKKLLRQGIPEQFCYWTEEEKVNDIVFLGSHNPTFPYREATMDYLKNTFPNFRWLGQRTSDYRGDKLNKLVGQTKIMIGDSMWSPEYWSNRVYELVGRGAFLITPRVPGLEKEFEYYKEIIPYDIGDYQGLKEKIEYFLKHDKEREAIARAGFERVKNNYLYEHRVKILL